MVKSLFPHEVRAALRHNWTDEGIDFIEAQVRQEVLAEHERNAGRVRVRAKFLTNRQPAW